MGDDVALVYACILDASSLEVISNNGYMYRYNDSSITHSYDANMANRCISLIEYMSKLLKRKEWGAENQLYAYTIMIQALVVENEMKSSNKRHDNLKLWASNPCIRNILRTKHKVKVPLRNRVETFAMRSGMIWILQLISIVRNLKKKCGLNLQ